MKHTFTKYKKTLPAASQIQEMLQGKPKTHAEWANSFNVVGDINRIIISANKQLSE